MSRASAVRKGVAVQGRPEQALPAGRGAAEADSAALPPEAAPSVLPHICFVAPYAWGLTNPVSVWKLSRNCKLYASYSSKVR